MVTGIYGCPSNYDNIAVMEAYLVFNGAAGSTSEHDADFYSEALAQAGYSPVYQVTRTEDEVLEVLEKAKDLIVVVGGDGSLRAVATRMVGRGIPIALIPAGTANNVGMALGLPLDPKSVVSGLGRPRKLKVDLGVVRAPWGESYFLEGAGFGLYAEALARYKPEDGKSVFRGAKTLIELLAASPSSRTHLRINGREEEGEYLLVEAMNTPAVGPRMLIAPDADMSDGLFDLVKVEANSRDSYLGYLRGLISGDLPELDSVNVERVQSFEFLWTGFPIHQDAVYQALEDHSDAAAVTLRSQHGVWLQVECLPAALEFWLPEEPILEGAAAS
jgi:diacylglycerol kinase family enzyme